MKRMVLALLLLTGCEDDEAISPPPPQALTRDAMGHFCGMIVADHAGPKAQVFVAGEALPYWFTSVRDAKAFTILPDEPREVLAVYVTDMARAGSWESPDTAWMAAEEGHYVIKSARLGGMGQPEAVPFSTAEAARAFASEHGG
ncbi:MAG: nitrous oxide reductase accessory protein NosL, partial [Pseudomonadota bacterium]